MNNQIKATTARTLLGIFLGLSILGAGAGFYAGLQLVNQQATDVTHASEDASAGVNQVQDLQKLQVQLEQARVLVQKADTMFVSLTNYQEIVLTDLQAYAAASGLSITKTEFGVADVNSTATGETRPVTVTFAQPLSYASLLRFLQLTEGSLPKLTVNGLRITLPANTTGDKINVEPITLRISVK